MRNTHKLQVGDWVCTSYNIESGKFSFGKITNFKMEECHDIDLDVNETNTYEGEFAELKRSSSFWVLNDSEISKLLALKTKLQITNELKN